LQLIRLKSTGDIFSLALKAPFPKPPTEGGSFSSICPSRPAGPSIDEMQPSAGFADNRFVFVVWRLFTAIQPVLDLHQGCWGR
jgi:hypothetical protein